MMKRIFVEAEGYLIDEIFKMCREKLGVEVNVINLDPILIEDTMEGV